MHTYQNKSLAAIHTKCVALPSSEHHPHPTKLMSSRQTMTSAQLLTQCTRAPEQMHTESIKLLDGQAHPLWQPFP